jgi:predicted transcriptional regulator
MDFACKEFKVEDVIKCALNLTKADLKVMKYFLNEAKKWVDTESLSKCLELDISTIQRSVKKLHEKKLCRDPSRTWTEDFEHKIGTNKSKARFDIYGIHRMSLVSRLQ